MPARVESAKEQLMLGSDPKPPLDSAEPSEPGPSLPADEPSLEIPAALRTPIRRPQLPGATRDPASGNISGLGVGLAMAMDFVGTIGGGAAIGYVIDRWQQSLPTGTLIGLGVGFVGAMIRIIRTSQRAERRSQRRGPEAKRRAERAPGGREER